MLWKACLAAAFAAGAAFALLLWTAVGVEGLAAFAAAGGLTLLAWKARFGGQP